MFRTIFLKENNNKCPITNHHHCEYQKSVSLRKQISKIPIMCPRQCQIVTSNTSSIRSAKQLLNVINFKKNSSTDSSSGCSDKECSFKGCVKDLENHLMKECTLSRMKCEFYEYGCTEMVEPPHVQEHNQSYMAQHLQYVLNELKSKKSKSNNDSNHSSTDSYYSNNNSSSGSDTNNLKEELKKK